MDLPLALETSLNVTGNSGDIPVILFAQKIPFSF
jgi:hypothetical protein